MNETRLVVLTSILKQTRPFRLVDIVNDTGINSSNLSFHMNKLVDGGLVDKFGTTYSIANQEALVDTLSSLKSKRPQREIVNTEFYRDAGDLLDFVNDLLMAKTLSLPMEQELRRAAVAEITKTVDVFNELKRKLQRDTYSRNKAKKTFKKRFSEEQEFLRVWRARFERFGIPWFNEDTWSALWGKLNDE